MKNYYLNIVILEGCPYGAETLKLLNNNNNLKKNIITISHNDKDKYKTSEISTFPQIYLKRENYNGNLLLGGYSELKDFYNKFYKQRYSKENVLDFTNKTKWSKKATLRSPTSR